LMLDPEARVESLPVGAQQRLEIVKALARDAKLLILDEPTAVLAPEEGEELMRWIRRFRDEGRTVVLITHKLREAASVADDVTILRRGATILTGPATTLDEAAMVTALLGEAPGPRAAEEARGAERGFTPTISAPAPVAPGTTVAQLREVSVTDVRGGTALRDVSLDVRSGEIVGVAAVEGAGQHALVRLLAGRLQPTGGTASLPARIAFIPEDRHRDAMVLEMSLVENVALRDLAQRRGRMPWDQLRRDTEALAERFDVRAGGVESAGGELSGGNQQKLVLGRELGDRPAMVVAENPTRGLDIRATAAVQEHLRAARAAGSAVVLYSSDLDEVLALADRMIVVHNGRVQEVPRPHTREGVGRAMLGAP
jgi:general nucleoside transport system ATP-binding protein